MKPYTFLGLLLLIVVPSEVAAARPNIVFILADDLGIGDVKCYGGDRCQIETPNLDSLARDGIRFTDAHTVASVCVPARIAMMTGRYPWRFQPPRPDGPWGFLNPRLDNDEFTLSRMLQQAGYRTGYVGKWHLGTLMQTTDGENQGPTNVDYTKPLKSGPRDLGFDDTFILPGSLDMYPYAFVRGRDFVGSVTAKKGWSAFNRVGPAAEDFEDVQVLDTFCKEAERFIREQKGKANPEQPFFLYLALTAPHTPTSPSAKFEGKSKLGLYGDFVMETDDCVGRVLRALRENDLEENTVVIASSDHGAGPYAGNIRKATPGQLRDLEKLGHYSSSIYRGYKFSAYEGGLRVPLLVRWPSVVPAGTDCDALVGLIDLLRTCAELGEAELSADIAVDSISFASLLLDPRADATRKDFVMQATRAFAVRSGKWKLAICPGSGCPGALGNTPKQQEAWQAAIQRNGRPPSNRSEMLQAPFVQLFDLSSDLGESENLAAQHPTKVRELIAMLDRYIDQGRSTPGPSQDNDKVDIDYLSGVPTEVRAASRQR
jgi:arylsulfatase A-like enzyme